MFLSVPGFSGTITTVIAPAENSPDPNDRTTLYHNIGVFNPNPFPVPITISILSALNSNQQPGPAGIGGQIVQFTTIIIQRTMPLPAFAFYTVSGQELYNASGEVIQLPFGINVPVAVVKIDYPDEVTRTVNQISGTVKVKELIFVQHMELGDNIEQHPMSTDTVVKPME